MSEEVSSVTLLDSDEDVSRSVNGETVGAFSSVEFPPDPESLKELLGLPNLFRLLAKGVIFIQNRKASSDQLLCSLKNFSSDPIVFDVIQTHCVKPPTILRRIKSVKSTQQQKVLVIDITGTVGNINKFCTDIVLANRNGRGVWVRGYVRDLSPKVIALFDALFAFDMSDREYEILRTSIAIDKGMISEVNAGGMLFFLNHGRIREAPLLARNPTVIRYAKGDIMDPNWVLVTVEIARFLFNDLKDWLGLNSQDSSIPEKVSQFEILNKNEFESLTNDNTTLMQTIDEAALEAHFYRIKGLRDQIVIHIKNYTDLQTTEAEMGILAPTHVKRGKEKESEAIAKKANELQILLSTVLNRNLQV